MVTGVGQSDDWMRELEALVRQRRGLDLGCYRRSALGRRLTARLLRVGLPDLESYVERLRQGDEAEIDRFVEDLTIKVSQFYRHSATFDRLASTCGALVRERGGAVRVWSAGCGRGEEAYTLAMLLADAGLGTSGSMENVLGTDVDRRALDAAEKGCYPAKAVSLLPVVLAERHLVLAGGQVEVSRAIRSLVRLAYHDLTTGGDPPAAGGFDLICCRNVLIYFATAWHEPLQRLLLDHLLPGGFLCLGESEWLAPALDGEFDIVDRAVRLFRRKAR